MTRGVTKVFAIVRLRKSLTCHTDSERAGSISKVRTNRKVGRPNNTVSIECIKLKAAKHVMLLRQQDLTGNEHAVSL